MEVFIINPRLYDFSMNIEDYSHNGYGFFTDITSCGATRNLSGDETFSMTILDTDRLAKSVFPNMCILAKPSYADPPQIYIITTVSYNDGRLDISAEHIKVQFFNNIKIGSPYSETTDFTGTPQQIIDELINDNYLLLPNQFSFSSDIAESKTLEVAGTQLTLGQIFDDNRQGLISLFDGEFIFDNFDIQFNARRGDPQASRVVRYGTNLSSYSQTISNLEEYSHILPYANVSTLERYEGDIYSVLLYGLYDDKYLIPTTNPVKERTNILPVDFSNKFKSKKGYVDPSSSLDNRFLENRLKIGQYGVDYVNKHNRMKAPNVNVVVNYESALDDLGKVELGDSVKVIYDPIGYEHNHRVIETTYDPVNERYTSVIIGDRKYSLYNFIKGM